MSEKKIDFLITKFNYNTEHNSELFGSLTPDGWLIDSIKKIIVVSNQILGYKFLHLAIY